MYWNRRPVPRLSIRTRGAGWSRRRLTSSPSGADLLRAMNSATGSLPNTPWIRDSSTVRSPRAGAGPSAEDYGPSLRPPGNRHPIRTSRIQTAVAAHHLEQTAMVDRFEHQSRRLVSGHRLRRHHGIQDGLFDGLHRRSIERIAVSVVEPRSMVETRLRLTEGRCVDGIRNRKCQHQISRVVTAAGAGAAYS